MITPVPSTGDAKRWRGHSSQHLCESRVRRSSIRSLISSLPHTAPKPLVLVSQMQSFEHKFAADSPSRWSMALKSRDNLSRADPLEANSLCNSLSDTSDSGFPNIHHTVFKPPYSRDSFVSKKLYSILWTPFIRFSRISGSSDFGSPCLLRNQSWAHLVGIFIAVLFTIDLDFLNRLHHLYIDYRV